MFVIAEPVSGSVCTPHGEVVFDFKAGEYTPKGPDDEVVLVFLAQIGAATQEEAKPRPRRSKGEE